MSKTELRLTLPGALSISRCEELRAQFGAALENGDDICIDVEPEAEADLTFLQILVASQRSAAARGKRIRFAKPPAGALAEALKTSGFRCAPDETALDRIFAPQTGASA